MRAVDILFEAEFRDVDPVEITEDRIELAKDQANQVRPVADYTRVIVEGVAIHLDKIDDTIARHLSSEWRLDRLPAVERAVLRVSTWELLHNADDVPRDVAVKEGIQLASAYSHVKAAGYVNAVLDGISREQDLKIADAAEQRREAAVDNASAADEFAPEIGDLIAPEVAPEAAPEVATESTEAAPSDEAEQQKPAE